MIRVSESCPGSRTSPPDIPLRSGWLTALHEKGNQVASLHVGIFRRCLALPEKGQDLSQHSDYRFPKSVLTDVLFLNRTDYDFEFCTNKIFCQFGRRSCHCSLVAVNSLRHTRIIYGPFANCKIRITYKRVSLKLLLFSIRLLWLKGHGKCWLFRRNHPQGVR